VLELDRKVRDFEHVDPSKALKTAGVSILAHGPGAEPIPEEVVRKKKGRGLGMEMQTYITAHVKEHCEFPTLSRVISLNLMSVMFHLHRAFFSHALSHYPDAPLDSPYATSVLALFRCAVNLVERVKMVYERLPEEVIPLGQNFSDLVSSAVSSHSFVQLYFAHVILQIAMGAICTKAPRVSLAPLAYKNLRTAVWLAETRFNKPRGNKGTVCLQG
jgi:hypothetical protein